MPFDEEELDPHGECAAEIERLRAGLNGLVNCQSPLTRSQLREAAAEIIAGHTSSLQDQSPFVAALTASTAREAALREALEAASHYIQRLEDCHMGKSVRDLDEACVAYEIRLKAVA